MSKEFEYTVNNKNQIVNPRGETINKPAVMFDHATGTLHVHGEESFVKEQYEFFKKRDVSGFIIKDISCFSWNMKYCNPVNVIEEINKMISISGYAKRFYEKEIACDY